MCSWPRLDCFFSFFFFCFRLLLASSLPVFKRVPMTSSSFIFLSVCYSAVCGLTDRQAGVSWTSSVSASAAVVVTIYLNCRVKVFVCLFRSFCSRLLFENIHKPKNKNCSEKWMANVMSNVYVRVCLCVCAWYCEKESVCQCALSHVRSFHVFTQT